MNFQSIVIPLHYHNKFSKFVCNVTDLCTTQPIRSNNKNRLEFPFKICEQKFPTTLSILFERILFGPCTIYVIKIVNNEIHVIMYTDILGTCKMEIDVI